MDAGAERAFLTLRMQGATLGEVDVQSESAVGLEMKKWLSCALLALAPCLSSASVLTGDTVTLTYNPGVFGPVNATVGAGNDFTVGLFDYDFDGGVNGNTFTWSARGTGALAGSTSFTISSLDFTDASTLTGFLVDASQLTGVSIVVGAHDMTVNFSNAGTSPVGVVFSGRFVTTADNRVPEPAALALALTALGLLGVSSRKRPVATAAG